MDTVTFLMKLTTPSLNAMLATVKEYAPHISECDAKIGAYFVASHNYYGMGDPLYAIACSIDLSYSFSDGELHSNIPDAAFAYDIIADEYGYPLYEAGYEDQSEEA